MSTVSVVETLNQFFITKYPGLFLLLLAIAFAWFTTSHLNSLNRRVEHIENVEIREIRGSIKETRDDIVRLDVKVDNLEKKVDELTVEVKALHADVTDLKVNVARILAIVNEKKNP